MPLLTDAVPAAVPAAHRSTARTALFLLAVVLAATATACANLADDLAEPEVPPAVSDAVTIQALTAGVAATQTVDLLNAGGLTLSSPELFTELVAEQLLVRGYAVIGIDNVAPPTQGGQPGPDVVASILADAAAAYLPNAGAALTSAQAQAFMAAVVAASPAVQPITSV